MTIKVAHPPSEPWVYIVIHPQDGQICDSSMHMTAHVWPEDGFFTENNGIERLWPVPRLKGARLVDCGACHRTGIQPRTWEDACRYIPGSYLTTQGGTVTLTLNTLAPAVYPSGAGEDEIMGNLPEGLAEQDRRKEALNFAHQHVRKLCDEKGSETHNRNQERHGRPSIQERVDEELKIARYLLAGGTV